MIQDVRDSGSVLSQEVELRVLLTAEQKEQICQQLSALGACARGKALIKDAYYCPKAVTSFEQIAMNEIGSFSLRIRTEERDGVMQVQLNTKAITTYGDHHAWEEHEVAVDSAIEARALLSTLGYKLFCQVDKERSLFTLGRMTICVDEIDKFGWALEIEIIACPATAEAAKREIKEFLRSLSITQEQILPKSVTYLVMQTASRF